MLARCVYCQAMIDWREKVDGTGKIPLNVMAVADGALVILPNGKVEKSGMRIINESIARYRSHLLDCPPLRKQLYEARHIKLPVETVCDAWEGCTRTDKHYHCFKCGSTEHFADDGVCDDDRDTIHGALPELEGEPHFYRRKR